MTSHRLTTDEVRRLYDRHGPALLLYARSYVADAGAAEDVVHGVFLKLLGSEPVVLETPAAYLYRAVRNTALNAIRSRSREAPLPDAGLWFESGEHDRETTLTLQQALADLPDEQREAVIMRIWSGMTIEEIAAASDVPLSTAASRYRYAIAKLRDRLKSAERSDKERP